jgi:hypothetical protein
MRKGGMAVTIGAITAMAILAARPAWGAEERVLVDMTIRTLPAPGLGGGNTGACFMAHPGRLTAMVQIADERKVVPVRFMMGIYGNIDAEQVNTMAATAPATYSIPSDGGLYCYNLGNEVYLHPTVLKGDAEPHALLVALRLVWSPPTP